MGRFYYTYRSSNKLSIFPPAAFLYQQLLLSEDTEKPPACSGCAPGNRKADFYHGQGNATEVSSNTRCPLHLCMHTSCPCARNRGRCPQISLLPGLSSQPEAITPFHRWRHKRCSADAALARAGMALHQHQTWLAVTPAAALRQCEEGTGHLPRCAASDAKTAPPVG